MSSIYTIDVIFFFIKDVTYQYLYRMFGESPVFFRKSYWPLIYNIDIRWPCLNDILNSRNNPKSVVDIIARRFYNIKFTNHLLYPFFTNLHISNPILWVIYHKTQNKLLFAHPWVSHKIGSL